MTINRLTEDDKNLLLDKSLASLSTGNFAQTLKYLQPLASWHPSDPYIFQLQAYAYAGLRDWDHAINNIQQVIRLNPDHADGYLDVAIYLTLKLSDERPESFLDHHDLIKEVLDYYNLCLERDPSNRTAWLNAAETYLFIRHWDDALSYYALGKPYMNSTRSKLTHEWIGCLALTLAGEAVTDDDRHLLDDQSIHMPQDSHDTEQIRILLNELENDNFDSYRLKCAWHIHNEFLMHFDASHIPAATAQN